MSSTFLSWLVLDSANATSDSPSPSSFTIRLLNPVKNVVSIDLVGFSVAGGCPPIIYIASRALGTRVKAQSATLGERSYFRVVMMPSGNNVVFNNSRVELFLEPAKDLQEIDIQLLDLQGNPLTSVSQTVMQLEILTLV